jgi:hypothetical protein
MAHFNLCYIVTICLSFPAYMLADTSHFKLELTWGKGAPDGYGRDMIFINGQYPGPLLDIRQDDWVEIEVVNRMPFSTTIHAHGRRCMLHVLELKAKIRQAFLNHTRHGQMAHPTYRNDPSSQTLPSHIGGRPMSTEATCTMRTVEVKSRTAHTAQSSSDQGKGHRSRLIRLRTLITKNWKPRSQLYSLSCLQTGVTGPPSKLGTISSTLVLRALPAWTLYS